MRRRDPASMRPHPLNEGRVAGRGTIAANPRPKTPARTGIRVRNTDTKTKATNKEIKSLVKSLKRAHGGDVLSEEAFATREKGAMARLREKFR